MRLSSRRVYARPLFLSLLSCRVSAHLPPGIGDRISLNHRGYNLGSPVFDVATATHTLSATEASSSYSTLSTEALRYGSSDIAARELPDLNSTDTLPVNLQLVMDIQAQLENATNMAVSYMMNMYQLAVSLDSQLSQRTTSSSTTSQKSISFPTPTGLFSMSSRSSSIFPTPSSTTYVNPTGVGGDLTETLNGSDSPTGTYQFPSISSRTSSASALESLTVDPIDSTSSRLSSTGSYGTTSTATSKSTGAGNANNPCGLKSSSYRTSTVADSSASKGPSTSFSVSVSVSTTTVTVRTGDQDDGTTSSSKSSTSSERTTTLLMTKTTSNFITITPAAKRSGGLSSQRKQHDRSTQSDIEKTGPEVAAHVEDDTCEESSYTTPLPTALCNWDHGSYACTNSIPSTLLTATMTTPLTIYPTGAYQLQVPSVASQPIVVVSGGFQSKGRPVGLFRALADVFRVSCGWLSSLLWK